MPLEQKYLTIGEVAKITDVTVKALRFYDKIGLLNPEYTDPKTKYRYYGINQLIYIDLIKAARNLEISPNLLIPYFAEKDTDGLIRLMHRHKDILAEKIYGLKKTMGQIETLENTLETAAQVDKSGNIYIREIPDRYAVTRPLDLEQSQEYINISFYLLNTSLNQMGLTRRYEEGIILAMDKDTLWPECIYTCVTQEEKLSDYRLLPGGSYLCTIFQHDNVQQQYVRLLEYAWEHGLKPQFVVQTELMTDFFVDMPEYFEAQIKMES